MTVYLALPLVEVFFCLALLVVLLTLGRQHVARKAFVLYLGFMALWGIFIFLMRFADDLETAAFWENFVFAAILSSAVSFYGFIISLTGTHPRKRTVLPIITAYIVAMACIPLGLVFEGMQVMWYGKAPIIGPLFPFYVLCVYAPIFMSLLILVKSARRTRSTDERVRLQYISIGIIALFIGGTTDYLPALGISLYPLGIIGNIIFCLLTTVAMLRYGLMEIRVVLRTGATYSLVSILIFGIFGSLILIANTLFQSVFSPLSLTLTITCVFIIAAILQPLLLKLQRLVDRWFFRKRYDYLQALKRFAHEPDADLDIGQLADTLVTTVAQGMQSYGVHLLLPSAVTREYSLRAFSGQKKGSDITFALSSPLAIALKYQDHVIDSYDMDINPALSNLVDKERKALAENNIELILPFKKENTLVGILLLGRKLSHEPYSNEEKQLLNSVSSEIALRIDQASRFENMLKANSELQKTMDGVIYAISAVVESRDPYTAGHQRRVAELAKAIGAEMGLSEWRLKGLRIMGLLHDVGKTAIPAEILSKPGKISQYEFNIIKNHASIGYDILEKVEFPWPVAQAILQHHERLDGSGYPSGLKDKQIILEAKILGVADVVEAMSSHRPYRPALGLSQALNEIEQQAGILYDREVVEACLRLLRESDFVFERLMTAASSPQETVNAGG